ncbi:MAG: flotillin family protein [Labilithrix sp.]|nr:flotillin family protein [Labilithrix sp.]MCW5812514.1 flotillin family protein [Labilithrix sp.]
MIVAVVIVVVAVLAVASVMAIINKLVHICQPNEVLVFSGTQRRQGDRALGYRLVQGGRGILIPLLERVDRLDLTNMIVDVRVEGAYSKGGIPLNVNAVANVKIASTEPVIRNAIERFLGKPRKLVETVAKETLEGNLRGVLATLTPEEVNHDRVKFAQSLLHEADSDLRKLGLVLDTLKIQHVSDDKGYLDSLGRRQSAELIMRSRVAEAENRALSTEREAANFETRSLARIDADVEKTRAEVLRRIVDAQSKREALAAETRAEVVALIARADAEIEVQGARLEQIRLQLEADRIRAAEAERERRIALARGAVASIVENGRAQARSLTEVSGAWNRAGGEARRIFVAQRLGTLAGQMLDTVAELPIENVTVIDGRLHGEGRSLAATSKLAAVEIGAGLGVDVVGAASRVAAALGVGEAAPARSDV